MNNNTTNILSRRNFISKLGIAIGGIGASPSLSIETTPPTPQKKYHKAQRVIMLALDGICVNGFIQAKTPNLDSLTKQGALSLDTRVVMPSFTLPNWTSHLTGSGPEQHGVFSNSWTIKKATNKSAYPPVRIDKKGYFPSVFQILKEELPSCKTSFYWNWKPLINPYNEQYLDEISFLENDAYKENYERAFRFIKKHRSVPSVTFLYTVHTDHAGHKYKWMSPEYIRSIEEADEEIGKLLQKLKQENLFNDSHIFFLTDHGGIGNKHGGTSPAEMIVPWSITGPRIKKNFKITEPNNTVNTASMILHLFGIPSPDEWTGEIINSIFE